MTSSTLNWDLYRSFLAVLRTGTLSAAAKQLGMTQPTLGRHIDAMEESIGVLFIRSQQGFSPTEAAIRLRPYAESLESTTAALLREASNKNAENAGTVRITASEIIGNEVLPKILSELHKRHPKIAIELVLSNELDNLLTRAADIAVRMDRPDQLQLHSKKVGTIEVGLYAHQKYLSQRGTPLQKNQLLEHSLIGFDTENEFIRDVLQVIGVFKRESIAFRSDSDLAQLSALRAGFGIGFCQKGIANRDANLTRILPKQMKFELETWVVMHENLKSNHCCSIVFQELAKGLTDYIRQDS